MKLCLGIFFLSILTPNDSLGLFVPLYPLHSIGALKKSPMEINVEEQVILKQKHNADLLKLKELILAEARKSELSASYKHNYKLVHIT